MEEKYLDYDIEFDKEKELWLAKKDGIIKYGNKSYKKLMKNISDEESININIDNPINFYNMIYQCSLLCAEISIDFNKDDISVIVKDPANAVLIATKMKNKNKIKKSKKYGVNSIILSEILRNNICKDTKLKISIVDYTMKMVFDNGVIQEETVGLIESELIESDLKQKVPELEFNVTLNIDSKIFRNKIKKKNNYTFNLKDKKFIIESSSDLSESKTEFKEIILKENKEESKSKYMGEYLNNILKAMKCFKTIDIKFSNDFPLMISGENNILSTDIILAPMIECD